MIRDSFRIFPGYLLTKLAKISHVILPDNVCISAFFFQVSFIDVHFEHFIAGNVGLLFIASKISPQKQVIFHDHLKSYDDFLVFNVETKFVTHVHVTTYR